MFYIPYPAQAMMDFKPEHLYYSTETLSGITMPCPVNDIDVDSLRHSWRALDEALRQHPLRMMVPVILHHSGNAQHQWRSCYPACYLPTPRPDSEQAHPRLQAFFGNLNHRLAHYFHPKRRRRFDRHPYHALSQSLGNDATLVVFFFHGSNYRALGRATGNERHLQTQLRLAWLDTLGVQVNQFSDSSLWINVKHDLRVNLNTPNSTYQPQYDAMRSQLAWFTHRSLPASSVVHWRF